MKNILKGKRFANVEEVKQKMAEALKGININEFKNCLEQYILIEYSLNLLSLKALCDFSNYILDPFGCSAFRTALFVENSFLILIQIYLTYL